MRFGIGELLMRSLGRREARSSRPIRIGSWEGKQDEIELESTWTTGRAEMDLGLEELSSATRPGGLVECEGVLD
jgi:hypothetical protein